MLFRSKGRKVEKDGKKDREMRESEGQTQGGGLGTRSGTLLASPPQSPEQRAGCFLVVPLGRPHRLSGYGWGGWCPVNVSHQPGARAWASFSAESEAPNHSSISLGPCSSSEAPRPTHLL